jgi:hypothetical protein
VKAKLVVKASKGRRLAAVWMLAGKETSPDTALFFVATGSSGGTRQTFASGEGLSALSQAVDIANAFINGEAE